jgi:hypothetical protein
LVENDDRNNTNEQAQGYSFWIITYTTRAKIRDCVIFPLSRKDIFQKLWYIWGVENGKHEKIVCV